MIDQLIEHILKQAETRALANFQNIDRVVFAEMTIRELVMKAYEDGFRDSLNMLRESLKDNDMKA